MIKEADKTAPSNILEGMVSFRAVIAGMESGVSDRKIEKVLIDKTRVKNLGRHLSYVKAKSYQYGFSMENVEPEEIEKLAIGDSHGGLLILCSDRTLPVIDTIPPTPGGVWFFLDGIEDPYNFGYALRSIYASGAQGILLPKRNWMSAAGVVCRSSAGASEQIVMATVGEGDPLEPFRRAGYRILCADLDNSVSMWDCDLSAPLLLIVGGEKRGISREYLEKCDGIVRIDYGRSFPAALSAASAATVLSFEIARQNRK